MGKRDRRDFEQICIHLGAHKTATTYMQSTFEAIRNSAAGGYLGLLTPRGCRSMVGLTFHTFGRSDQEIDDIASRSCQCLQGWFCSELERGVTRILISEEQILGSSRLNISTETLYPRLIDRLRCIPEVWQSHNLAFFLAVRNYADFFTSSYSTTVQRGLRLDFSARRRSNLSRLPRRWTHVVHDVLSCFPKATLHLWRYEDFSSLRDELLWAATGSNDSFIWPKTRPMMSFTREEMEIALSSRPGEMMPREIRNLAALRFPKPHHKFDPWDPMMRADLNKLYCEDCKQLSVWPNVKLYGAL